jgi:hypothetical protein
MLDGVYVDMKGCRSVVAIKPKPPFRAVLQVVSTRADSDVTLISKEPLRSDRNDSFIEHMFLAETGESGDRRGTQDNLAFPNAHDLPGV